MLSRISWKTFPVIYKPKLNIGLAKAREADAIEEKETCPLRREKSGLLHNSVTFNYSGHNSNGQIY